MDTLKIALLEDHQADAEHLSALIKSSQIPSEITLFKSGEDFLSSHPAMKFDLVFLDIYIGEISGVQTARALRSIDDTCGIVFTTASRDHMPEAFDVGAEQYLVKPIDPVKLEKLLRKRMAALQRATKTCVVNQKGKPLEVKLDDICYVEGSKRNCYVHTVGGVIETGTTMKISSFELYLTPPRFIRCHQSFIVNMSYVKAIERDFIMHDGSRVYIRRGDVGKCVKAFNQWCLLEAREV